MWPGLFLPCTILFALGTLHTVINPLIAKYGQGNQWTPKNVCHFWIEHYYQRDYMRSNDPMRPWGIEEIPDIPPKIIDY